MKSATSVNPFRYSPTEHPKAIESFDGPAGSGAPEARCGDGLAVSELSNQNSRTGLPRPTNKQGSGKTQLDETEQPSCVLELSFWRTPEQLLLGVMSRAVCQQTVGAFSHCESVVL
jgi:hypothetical protein